MELKDYTTEQLRAELKRRNEQIREQKKRDAKAALRCRNCTHCIPNPNWSTLFQCEVRTYGKTRKRNYAVALSAPACDLFINKHSN